MKKLRCAQLIPHCPAQFGASTEREIVEQYAAHARSEHPQSIALTALLDAITVA